MKTDRKTRKKALLKKNRTAGHLRRLLRFLAISAPAAILLLSLYFIVSASGSLFRVHTFVFTGNTHLSDDELKGMTGLAGGENLLTMSGKTVFQKLIRSPWIRSAEVRKELPDKLHIQVREAEPFALLDLKGRLFIVDDRGSMLEELRGSPMPFLPVIAGDPYREKEAFSDAISLVRAMKAAGLPSRKDHIEIIAHNAPELTTNLDGVIVKIGTGDYSEKLARLKELEEEIRTRNIPVDYIDLRFSNKVVVKAVNEVIR